MLKVAVFLALLAVSHAALVAPGKEDSSAVSEITGKDVGVDLDIIEVANRLGVYSFLMALEETNLTDFVRRSSDITVFIPSNEAFLGLPESTRDQWRADPKAYQALMKYHVVQGRYPFVRLVDEQTLTTQDDNLLARFNIYNHTGQKNISTYQGSPIRSGEFLATNGFIYLIDQVVDHISTQTTLKLVTSTDDFSKLAQVVQAAGPDIINLLSAAADNHTLFAPNNEAFSKLPAGFFEKLLKSSTLSKNLLKKHITKLGTYFTAGIIDKEVIPTQDDKASITVNKASNPIRLNDQANIVSANNATTNGVVHVIDTILFDLKDSE